MQRTEPRSSFLSKGYYPCIIAACITELESVHSFMRKASTFVSEEQKRFRDRLGTQIEEENMGGHEADALYDAHYAEMSELHSFNIHLENHNRWDLILRFYRVRNCFVHANGDITLMNKQDVLDDDLPSLSEYGVVLPKNQRTLHVEESAVLSAVQAMEEVAKAFGKACRENEFIGPTFWP